MKKLRVFMVVFLLLGTLTAESISASKNYGPRPKKRVVRATYSQQPLTPDTMLLKAVRRLDASMIRLSASTKRMRP